MGEAVADDAGAFAPIACKRRDLDGVQRARKDLLPFAQWWLEHRAEQSVFRPLLEMDLPRLIHRDESRTTLERPRSLRELARKFFRDPECERPTLLQQWASAAIWRFRPANRRTQVHQRLREI